MAELPPRLRCTFVDCPRTFATVEERILHKDMEHDFCRPCNVDFPNYESMMLHKINSPNHIVCPICGFEFSSTSTRDQHVLRTHPIDHEIKCPFEGCDQQFPTPSGYIGHFERGRCASGVNKETLMVRREQKALDLDVSYRAMHGTLEIPSSFDDADSNGGGGGGGVTVDQNDGDMALSHQPRESRLSPFKAKFKNTFTPERPADGIVLTKRASEQAKAQQSSRPKPVVPRSGALKMYKRFLPRFDENQYRNTHTGKFECCQKAFESSDALAEHLRSHRLNRFTCPMCRKVMQSITALVAHVESSQKCGLSRRSDAAEIMSLITGGLVKADRWLDEDHYHLKYEAATHF